MVWFLVVAVIVVGGVPLLPRFRRKRVMRNADKIARAVSYADAGPDWPALYARMDGRYVGGQVGYLLGLAATWGFVAREHSGDAVVLLAVVAASGCTSVGTWVGHLRGARERSPVPRLVALRARRSEDYLTPWELRLVRACVLVPLAGLALGLGVESSGTSSSGGVTGGGLAAVSVAALGLGLASQALGRRTLDAPADMTTTGGLAWAEVLRAVMLRDVLAGLWAVATMIVILATVFMLSSLDAEPSWVVPAGVGLIAAATLVNLGLVWWSIRDCNHQWARQHAATGAA